MLICRDGWNNYSLDVTKNKHLADIAFVLRKHQDFLKVQEEVTKAQHNYNRILGYSKEEGDNAEYWKNQLLFYQKTIHLSKEKVKEEIEHLLQKGVNVTEIESKKVVTENKIEELDKKLEDLPNIREELVSKYRLEKEELLKINESAKYVGDRKVENSELFNASQFGMIEKENNVISFEDEQKSHVMRR